MPKCKKCKRSIRDGMRAVEALGAKWCWECFVCAVSASLACQLAGPSLMYFGLFRDVSGHLMTQHSSNARDIRSVRDALVLSSRMRCEIGLCRLGLDMAKPPSSFSRFPPSAVMPSLLAFFILHINCKFYDLYVVRILNIPQFVYTPVDGVFFYDDRANDLKRSIPPVVSSRRIPIHSSMAFAPSVFS